MADKEGEATGPFHRRDIGDGAAALQKCNSSPVEGNLGRPVFLPFGTLHQMHSWYKMQGPQNRLYI